MKNTKLLTCLILSSCICFFPFHLATSKTDLQDKSINPLGTTQAQIEDIPDWKARLELAKLLTYAKRYPEAIQAYKRVLKEKPELMEAKIGMAKAYFWSGNNTQALKLLESFPPKQLDDQARLAMADLYIAMKNYADAKTIFTDYLKTHPNDHKARLKLAQLLSWMKSYDKAISHYQHLTKALPDDREIKKKYAFVLIWAGKQDQAIKELQDALPE
ncbi:tetratricopeptide repeat protein [Desulfobacter curvatus]|uniref:tetratricopeptide repeat protein n=1 Tax=Desulfobacter curvatus TaxID=2290 RepID=UPI00037C8AE2|nr:tetratricopeptide repeat protein [Desulfobacter curvatus]